MAIPCGLSSGPSRSERKRTVLPSAMSRRPWRIASRAVVVTWAPVLIPSGLLSRRRSLLLGNSSIHAVTSRAWSPQASLTSALRGSSYSSWPPSRPASSLSAWRRSGPSTTPSIQASSRAMVPPQKVIFHELNGAAVASASEVIGRSGQAG